MEKTQTQNIPLGRHVCHSKTYDPSHLFPVPRKEARKALGLDESLPFSGTDIWNAFELSWLDSRGKPCIAAGEFSFPFNSENIVESKSMKLYLNSFNLTRFESPEKVRKTIDQDLSRAAGSRVGVRLLMPDEFSSMQIFEPPGTSLDSMELDIDTYLLEPAHLITRSPRVEERLYSNLLRTNCPVTGQPDWATLMIDYSGRKIDHEGLLRYIISFRQHTGFHENCVERIFMDLLTICCPERLTVNARFTRRGGLDINPFRSTEEKNIPNLRLARQ